MHRGGRCIGIYPPNVSLHLHLYPTPAAVRVYEFARCTGRIYCIYTHICTCWQWPAATCLRTSLLPPQSRTAAYGAADGEGLCWPPSPVSARRRGPGRGI